MEFQLIELIKKDRNYLKKFSDYLYNNCDIDILDEVNELIAENDKIIIKFEIYLSIPPCETCVTYRDQFSLNACPDCNENHSMWSDQPDYHSQEDML